MEKVLLKMFAVTKYKLNHYCSLYLWCEIRVSLFKLPDKDIWVISRQLSERGTYPPDGQTKPFFSVIFVVNP